MSKPLKIQFDIQKTTMHNFNIASSIFGQTFFFQKTINVTSYTKALNKFLKKGQNTLFTKDFDYIQFFAKYFFTLQQKISINIFKTL